MYNWFNSWLGIPSGTGVQVNQYVQYAVTIGGLVMLTACVVLFCMLIYSAFGGGRRRV